MEDANARVVVVNDGLCELFGLQACAQDLVGLEHAELVVQLGPDRAGWLHEPGGAPGREQRRTIEVATGNGRELEIDWVPIARGDEPLGRVWLVRDISERKQREAALETLAATDTLTGLPNRRSFLSRLEGTLAEARRSHGHGGALLMLDIDHFKRVNDTWGHAIGDEVLQHFADVVRQGLRRGDAAGRLGGEEFAVLLPATGLDDACALAERLRERVAASPAATGAGEVAVTVSIGVAGFDGGSATSLLSRADEALYAAKGAGRDRVFVAGAGRGPVQYTTPPASR
jgi:diguanylate cyclase (GGDEF)-like protein/PAS domain S-box-containing protein